MEGVAGDVCDAHIEHETKKLFVVSFFSDERKRKIPRYYGDAIDPTEKPKLDPFTRQVARRGRCIAFRVSAAIV